MFSDKPKLPSVTHNTCHTPLMMCSTHDVVWGFCEHCHKAGNIKLWVHPMTRNPRLIDGSYLAIFTDEAEPIRRPKR
jgi:hypothetical protein